MAEQKDTKYTYQGPLSGVTLPDGRSVPLVDGKEVELPADNKFVKRLVALERLVEINPEKGAKKTKEVVNAG